MTAYGSFTQAGFYTDVLAGYAYSGNQMQRQIVIPGLQPRNQFVGQVESGYKLGVYAPARATLTPFSRAEDRRGNELAEPLDRPTARRVLVEGQVCSAFVVIADVDRSDPTQMTLAEDNGMIEALPADRANQPLHMPVLPR